MDLFLGTAQLLFHCRGTAQERGADGGQAHSLGVALEQRGTEIVLNVADTTGNRRLAHAQMAAGGPQAAEFSSRQHVSYLTELHREYVPAPIGSICHCRRDDTRAREAI